MKILNLNVNGIRASAARGVVDFLRGAGDIICLQEIKATETQTREALANLVEDSLLNKAALFLYICSANKPGYSGTAILTKQKPISVKYELDGLVLLKDEGRVLVCEFENFFVVNCYVPHGNTRLDIKLDFLNQLLNGIKKLNKQVILCSDMNIAHTEKDLSHPKICSTSTGFLPVERQMFDKFIFAGLVDTFRYKNPDAQSYTWNSYRSKEGFNGWNFRFDYILVSESLKDSIKNATILYDKFFSDHYPIALEIDI